MRVPFFLPRELQRDRWLACLCTRINMLGELPSLMRGDGTINKSTTITSLDRTLEPQLDVAGSIVVLMHHVPMTRSSSNDKLSKN